MHMFKMFVFHLMWMIIQTKIHAGFDITRWRKPSNFHEVSCLVLLASNFLSLFTELLGMITTGPESSWEAGQKLSNMFGLISNF